MGLEPERLGRRAYDAYAMAAGGRDAKGLVLAHWTDLPERIREQWIAAAEAVADIVLDLLADEI